MSCILGEIKICNFGGNPKSSSCKERPRWVVSLIGPQAILCHGCLIVVEQFCAVQVFNCSLIFYCMPFNVIVKHFVCVVRIILKNLSNDTRKLVCFQTFFKYGLK